MLPKQGTVTLARTWQVCLTLCKYKYSDVRTNKQNVLLPKVFELGGNKLKYCRLVIIIFICLVTQSYFICIRLYVYMYSSRRPSHQRVVLESIELLLV